MMYEEFNMISGKVCSPDMYDKEVEPIYMEFDVTKKEMAALYWGARKGAYELYLEMKDLMRYIVELNIVPKDQFGLVEHMAALKIKDLKYELLAKVKALKVA
ncbi:MAG: hypothetical protein AB7F40_04450 [Victivallaceae bacterium]